MDFMNLCHHDKKKDILSSQHRTFCISNDTILYRVFEEVSSENYSKEKFCFLNCYLFSYI